jgi:hypothetical protein
MKRSSLGFLTATLFLIACIKDDTKKTINQFSFQGKTATTPYGYIDQYDISAVEIGLTSVALTTTYNGNLSVVCIYLDSLIENQTYTYKHYTAASYNKASNFSDAYVYYNTYYSDRVFHDTIGEHFSNITGGTITLRKSGEDYAILYSLQFDGTRTINGQYTGKLKIED